MQPIARGMSLNPNYSISTSQGTSQMESSSLASVQRQNKRKHKPLKDKVKIKFRPCLRNLNPKDKGEGFKKILKNQSVTKIFWPNLGHLGDSFGPTFKINGLRHV